MKIAQSESKRTLQHVNRKRGAAWSGAFVAVAVSAVVAMGLSGATDAPFTIKTFKPGAAQVTRFGAHAYPTNTCASSEPTLTLLPASAIPNMSQGTDITVQGNVPLVPSGFGIQVNPTSAVPTIAADLSENLVNTSAPVTAIQSASPFNLANPHTVTSFSEGISGFASSTVEGTYYMEGAAPQTPPESTVNGHLITEQVATSQNNPSLPTPNTVVVLSLPGTDTPSQVEITIESGSTVIGLTFEGGSSLSLADVQPYVTKALNQLAQSCSSLDIMKSAPIL